MSYNTSAIKFYLGEESRLVIDDFQTKNESIFKDSYNTALSIVKDFIRNEEKTKHNESAKNFFRQTADVIDNNIIAFIGERGTGKSSCMLSVANMLKNVSSFDDKIDTNFKEIFQNSFEILETIDPSFFDEKTNVLEIVLGRMFSNFGKNCKKRNNDGIEDFDKNKTELFKAFQKVKESVVNINGCQVSENDCVDGLLKLTASVDLRDSFKELIDKYLNFFKKDYLVISVDDLDLNTQQAYKMSEQIRKYLRQEKVIVLIALKLEQLEYAVQLQFETQYKEIKDKISLDIPEMVSKYILKLIPDNNRIYLPNIQLWANAEINIYRETTESTFDCKWKEKKWKLLNKLPRMDESNKYVYDDNKSNQTLKNYIVSLIFKKTRYLFYHTKNGISPIVPRNLREMRFLIELLENMDDYSEHKNEINKSVFKEYFITTWAANNLPQDKFLFIKQLFSISQPEIINKFIIENIKKFFQSKINLLLEENKEIKNIYNENNKAYNISLGDVMYVIGNLKNSFSNVDDTRFLFAIETFYSIRLYEYYDLMSEIEEDYHEVDSNISNNVKKKSILESYNSYTKLVGCNFINPSSQSKYLYRKFNIQTLKKIWEDIIQANPNNIPLIKLHLIEFYSLCFSVKGESDSNYRNKDEVAFDSELRTGQKWVAFDFMAIFANLPRIQKQYKRVNDYLNQMCQSNNDKNIEFLTLAKENNKSLYNQLIKYCEENRKYSKNKYISWVSIRNIEILDDFTQFIKRIWIKNEKDYFDSIERIIDSIVDKTPENNDEKKYKIFTYDYNDNEFYKVTFNFFKVILDLFGNDDFKNLFYSVESESESSSNEIEKKEIYETAPSISSLKLKTGSTARNIIYKLYPKESKDEKFKEIVKRYIPNKFRIYSIKQANSIVKEILENYEKLSHE